MREGSVLRGCWLSIDHQLIALKAPRFDKINQMKEAFHLLHNTCLYYLISIKSLDVSNFGGMCFFPSQMISSFAFIYKDSCLYFQKLFQDGYLQYVNPPTKSKPSLLFLFPYFFVFLAAVFDISVRLFPALIPFVLPGPDFPSPLLHRIIDK